MLPKRIAKRHAKPADDAVVNPAEGSLKSEDANIEEQAQVARPDKAENLLAPAPGADGNGGAPDTPVNAGS